MDKLAVQKVLNNLIAYRDSEKEKHQGASGLNMAINELTGLVAEDEKPFPALDKVLLDFIDEVTNYYCGDKTVLSTPDRMNIINNSPIIVKLDILMRQKKLVENTKRPILHEQAETFLYCSLDEQQCRDSCEHKNDRINCPCVTITNKKRV